MEILFDRYYSGVLYPRTKFTYYLPHSLWR